MAFTYGFYDSINHDRRYTADQVSSLFDGLITDGVFDTIGEKLSTIPGEDLQVLVKPGKAWFDHTWSINDADYPLYLDTADVTMSRIDAIVLEIDKTESVRANSLKVIKGTAATNPTRPRLTNTERVHQYPLSYVTIPGSATSIRAQDIDIVVGMSATPFVTGLVEHVDITDLFSKWNGEFDTWFDNLKAQLSDNVVTNLQAQIDEVKATVPVQILEGIEDYVNTYGLQFLFDRQFEVFTESGTWTAPSDIANDEIFIVMCGGGGGNGGTGSHYDWNPTARRIAGGKGGYGGSGYIEIATLKITPGETYRITIGGGGTGGIGGDTKLYQDGGSGGTGGTTTFATNSGVIIISAAGGKGGGGGRQGYSDCVSPAGSTYGRGGNGGNGEMGGAAGTNGNMVGASSDVTPPDHSARVAGTGRRFSGGFPDYKSTAKLSIAEKRLWCSLLAPAFYVPSGTVGGKLFYQIGNSGSYFMSPFMDYEEGDNYGSTWISYPVTFVTKGLPGPKTISVCGYSTAYYGNGYGDGGTTIGSAGGQSSPGTSGILYIFYHKKK